MITLSPSTLKAGFSGLMFFKRSFAGIVIVGSTPSFNLTEPSAFVPGTKVPSMFQVPATSLPLNILTFPLSSICITAGTSS